MLFAHLKWPVTERSHLEGLVETYLEPILRVSTVEVEHKVDDGN